MLTVPQTRTTSAHGARGGRVAGDLEGDVDAGAVGPSLGPPDHVRARAHVLESEALENVQAKGVHLDDRDAGAALAGDQRDQRSDRAAPEHEHGVAALHIGPRHVVHRHRQWLDDRRVVVGDGVGHPEQP
jgi:hypothetical protein